MAGQDLEQREQVLAREVGRELDPGSVTPDESEDERRRDARLQFS